MKNRIKIIFRALTQRNVILIYSKRVKGDIEAKVITDTRFTVKEDKAVLMSASVNLNPHFLDKATEKLMDSER